MEFINEFFGSILNLIFNGVSSISPVWALGISIILFTLVTRIILTPLQMSSQRTSRGMSKIQPELQKIQEKYKGKTDQQSQMQQSLEMQALYKKYNIKPLAGCLPLLIQLPLIWALFKVLRTPAKYITKLGNEYNNLAQTIMSKVNNYPTYLEKFQDAVQKASQTTYDINTQDGLGHFLSHLNSYQWHEFQSSLDQTVNNVIQPMLNTKNSFEQFLGMNVVDTPALLVKHGQFWVLLVPIIAGVSTYIFSKISMAANGNMQSAASDTENSMQTTMKFMNMAMPVMTAGFAWSMPIGLAIYWISSNLIMMVQQAIVNKILNKQDAVLEEQLKKEREASGKPAVVTKKKVLKKVPVQKDNNKKDASKIETRKVLKKVPVQKKSNTEDESKTQM